MLSVSSESELQTLLYLLSISISLSRNLTLNDLGRCCGIRVTPGSVQHLAILLVRFIARLYMGNLFSICSESCFCQKFVALAYQRFDQFQNSATPMKLREPKASGDPVRLFYVWSRNIIFAISGYILLLFGQSKLLWQRKKQNS